MSSTQLSSSIVKLQRIIRVNDLDLIIDTKEVQHVFVTLLARLSLRGIDVSKFGVYVLHHMSNGFFLKPVILGISSDDMVNCDVVPKGLAVYRR